MRHSRHPTTIHRRIPISATYRLWVDELKAKGTANLSQSQPVGDFDVSQYCRIHRSAMKSSQLNVSA